MESSDEEDDMLTIKRKDHEIQDEDGKFLSKKTLTANIFESGPLPTP